VETTGGGWTKKKEERKEEIYQKENHSFKVPVRWGHLASQETGKKGKARLHKKVKKGKLNAHQVAGNCRSKSKMAKVKKYQCWGRTSFWRYIPVRKKKWRDGKGGRLGCWAVGSGRFK